MPHPPERDRSTNVEDGWGAGMGRESMTVSTRAAVGITSTTLLPTSVSKKLASMQQDICICMYKYRYTDRCIYIYVYRYIGTHRCK